MDGWTDLGCDVRERDEGRGMLNLLKRLRSEGASKRNFPTPLGNYDRPTDRATERAP